MSLWDQIVVLEGQSRVTPSERRAHLQRLGELIAAEMQLLRRMGMDIDSGFVSASTRPPIHQSEGNDRLQRATAA